MAVKTQLAELIRVTNDKARYDKQVKKLLSVKAILAWILKTCTDEFSSFSTQEIINCIQGEPEISLRAVHPNEPDAGASMLDGDDRIIGLNTEDNFLGEGTVYYDIRLQAVAPNSKTLVQLIINIEAQLDTSPGYPIEKRAVYYCCRMISGQYGTVFYHSEYGKLRKVYSIWFCSGSSLQKQNTIKKISLGETAVYGTPDTSGKNSDLMQAVIVHLGDANVPVGNQILRLMNVLLSEKTDAIKKQQVMEEEFHIAMTADLKTEVEELCNLSDGIYKKGRSEGRDEGLRQGIEGAVQMLRSQGNPDEQIIEMIMQQYDLTLETAKGYVMVPV